jgi:hypothetical protein
MDEFIDAGFTVMINPGANRRIEMTLIKDGFYHRTEIPRLPRHHAEVQFWIKDFNWAYQDAKQRTDTQST